MRIGIDARFYGPVGKGLGRYTQKLIEKLERIDPENEYCVFLRKENFDHYQPNNPRFGKVLADYRWYSFSEQLFFPRLLWRHDLDLVHFPHFNVPLLYRRKFIVTIHDLILVHFPTVKGSTLNPLFYWLKFLVYKLVIGSAIRRAEKIVAVSDFTRNDILDNYGSDLEKKIVVTYEACEDHCMLSPEKDAEILRRYGIMEQYLIYVGNAYPHKNLERLLTAFASLEERFPGLGLVLVGKEDYFYRRLKKMVSDRKIKHVIFAGYVPDYDLDVLKHNARAFVFPSLYEGFGLPPLEAMACGTPVISSDHPCMREILGGSAYYFDGKNEQSIIEAMGRIISDRELRAQLIVSGYERIRKYDWKRMAKETMTIYMDIKGEYGTAGK